MLTSPVQTISRLAFLFLDLSARKLQSITLDREVNCYGGTENFETPAVDSGISDFNETFFVFKYPSVNSGDRVRCNMQCSTTTGISGMVVISGDGDAIDSTQVDESSTVEGVGCPLGISLNANQTAPVLVAAFCEDGCAGANMVCNRDCGGASLQSIRSAFSGVQRMFRNAVNKWGPGGRRLGAAGGSIGKYYMRGTNDNS